MTTLALSMLVFSSQFILVLLKHLNVRFIVERQVLYSALLTLGIQACWLVASAIGISAVLEYNWWVVAAYLIGGVMGNFMNFMLKK